MWNHSQGARKSRRALAAFAKAIDLGDARALHLRIEGQLQLGQARLHAETSQVLAERKRDGIGQRAARAAGLFFGSRACRHDRAGSLNMLLEETS